MAIKHASSLCVMAIMLHVCLLPFFRVSTGQYSSFPVIKPVMLGPA